MSGVTVVRDGQRVAVTSVSGGASVRVSGVGTQGPPGPVQPKGWAFEWPAVGETPTLMWTPFALTLVSLHALVRGDDVPAVDFTAWFGPDRNAPGTRIAIGAVTDDGAGVEIALEDAAVPADSYVWLEIAGVSGTVRELHLTLWF